MASHKLGATMTPVNVRYKARELRHQLRHSGANTLIFDAEYATVVADVRSDALVECYVCIGDPVPDWAVSYERFIADAGYEEPPQPNIGPDDPSAILYTSGTTGVSKGVPMFYWGGLYVGAMETNLDVGLTRRDVSLCVAPLFHQAAHCFVLLMPLMVGGKVVILPKFDPDACVRAIAKHDITFTFLVPTMTDELLHSPLLKIHDTSTLSKLLSSGSAITEPMKRALLETFPRIEIFENYGATESFNSTRLMPQDVIRKEKCAGLPIPTQQVRIVDHENRDVEVASVGEIIVKGPATFRGYLNAAEGSDNVIDADGWFHTGDLGRFDEEGFIYIVGRAKEMIKSGGENIYPREIEEVILEIEGVRDCAVVGLPDAYWGEIVCAAVVRDETSDLTGEDIVAACIAELAGYKKPKRVEFFDNLPRNPAGKVVKPRITEIIIHSGTSD